MVLLLSVKQILLYIIYTLLKFSFMVFRGFDYALL